MVAASMPPNTVVPIDWRLAAPAPDATISGTTPRMKAKAVMRIGTQTQAPRFHRGVDDAEPLLAAALCEFDDQNRILSGKADQHHEADLRIDVDLQSTCPEREQSTEERQRHREQHHEGHGPAFVLRGQDQKDEDDR